jgi:hypothetical protein
VLGSSRPWGIEKISWWDLVYQIISWGIEGHGGIRRPTLINNQLAHDSDHGAAKPVVA